MDKLAELDGTFWAGGAELWLDPPGDNVVRSDCTISVHGQGVRYTWSHDGKDHEGRITLRQDGADFTDTLHLHDSHSCQTQPY